MTVWEEITSEKALLVYALIVTIGLFIYAALSYHRPPASRNASPMYTETSGPRPFSHVKFRTIFASALGILFAALTVYLILTSSPGMGPRGPKGERGPAGLPAPVDPKAAMRATVVDAMARVAYLKKQYAQFENTQKEYSSQETTILQLISSDSPYVDKQLSNYSIMSNPPDKELTELAKQDLGLTINLDIHPNFSLNPLAPVPGDASITSERMKGEFRRIYDEYHTAQRALTQVEQEYQSKIDGLERSIENYGMTVPSNR